MVILCTSLELLRMASTRRLARGPGRTTAGQRKAGLAFHLGELRERLAPPGPRSELLSAPWRLRASRLGRGPRRRQRSLCARARGSRAYFSTRVNSI